MTATELVRSAVDAINRHDIEALKATWAPDLHERFPDGDYHGRDATAAYFQRAFDAMPDLRLEILGLSEQDGTVFMRWRMTGHHTGATWNGIAASGRRVELDGIDHFEVRGGLIATNFVVYDQLQFARAVGLVPQEGSPGDRALKAAFAARIKVTEKLRG